jgi:hypothetical protein
MREIVCLFLIHLTSRYAALLSIEAIVQDVMKKLLAMLLHPLPRVCTFDIGLTVGESCSR